MKRTLLVMSALFGLGLQPAQALNAKEYKALIIETFNLIDAGSPDIDNLVEIQQKLIAIGIAGAREYVMMNPGHAEIVNFTIDNADNMIELSYDEIEAAWLDGEAFEDASLDIEALPEDSMAVMMIDSIVHPATALVALREYTSTQDEEYLALVQDELSEVVDHLEETK